jgi:hypothetical protein
VTAGPTGEVVRHVRADGWSSGAAATTQDQAFAGRTRPGRAYGASADDTKRVLPQPRSGSPVDPGRYVELFPHLVQHGDRDIPDAAAYWNALATAADLLGDLPEASYQGAVQMTRQRSGTSRPGRGHDHR